MLRKAEHVHTAWRSQIAAALTSKPVESAADIDINHRMEEWQAAAPSIHAKSRYRAVVTMTYDVPIM